MTHPDFAVIENLIKGKDEHVRAAEVRTSSGRTNQPINQLYLLEISCEKDDMVDAGTIRNEDDDQQCADDVDEHSTVMGERPIRSSAAKAQLNISRWSKEILCPALEDVEN